MHQNTNSQNSYKINELETPFNNNNNIRRIAQQPTLRLQQFKLQKRDQKPWIENQSKVSKPIKNDAIQIAQTNQPHIICLQETKGKKLRQAGFYQIEGTKKNIDYLNYQNMLNEENGKLEDIFIDFLMSMTHLQRQTLLNIEKQIYFIN